MGRNEGKKKHEVFEMALNGKKIPLLTLDSKWYQLLTKVGRSDVKPVENEINRLLQRQGKLNNDSKDIKKLKKKLMGEIVTMVDEFDKGGGNNKALEKKIGDNKRLVEECSVKLEEYENELFEIPREIDRLNKKLMLMTMENCYDIIQDNTENISEISDWVEKTRIELKKQLVRKQEMEQRNNVIYSYMHDIFGAEVVNMFDMKFNPKESQKKPAGKNVQKKEME